MALLRPDAYFRSVLDIEPSWLVEKGVRAVLLDLDNTLQPRTRKTLPRESIEWVEALKDAGLGVALVSNSAKERVQRAARELQVPLVENAYKPFTKGLRSACAQLGVEPSEAAMVGDQAHTDVLGANNCGMFSIYVDPQSDIDPVHTRFFRLVDRLGLHGMSPQEKERR